MRELLLEKETILTKNLIEPHLDDYAVLVSVHYSYINSGSQASLIAQAKRSSTTFGNIPQKIKTLVAALIQEKESYENDLEKKSIINQMPILGYACSGKIIAVGNKVTTFKTGDFVACAATGSIQYQEIVCVPVSHVVPLRSPEFLKKGCIAPLGAIALHAVRSAQLQLGDIVCVMGLGIIGQIIAQLAQKSGCIVVGLDHLEDRLVMATSAGIEYVCDAKDESLASKLSIITNGKGFDTTFLATSEPSAGAINKAVEYTRYNGRIVAWSDMNITISQESIGHKEIQLNLVTGFENQIVESKGILDNQFICYDHKNWSMQKNMQTVVHMMEKHMLHVDDFITYEEPIQEVDKAYYELKNRKKLGVIIKYNDNMYAQYIPAIKDCTTGITTLFNPINKEKISVGIVGAVGIEEYSFFSGLSSMSSVSINAVSDYTITQAQNLARKIGSTKTFSHENKLYKDKNIDAVIIASSDRLHAQQALTALSCGKAVFMTRPMVTTFEEYELFVQYLKRPIEVPLCVDYGSSFSTIIQKIKWEVTNRTSPLMIRYSVYTDFLKRQHVAQKGHSAGSVIDEASSIFELFSFLTASQPVAVSVESLRSFSSNCFPTDNFSAQISFSDGSICTLFYTSLAHAQSTHEEMEVFFDGKTIRMEDYKMLKGYGVSRNFDMELPVADRGSSELIESFFTSLKDNKRKMPFTKEHLSTIAYLTLIVDKLVCQGGGVEHL